jgi:hypothetical protein
LPLGSDVVAPMFHKLKLLEQNVWAPGELASPSALHPKQIPAEEQGETIGTPEPEYQMVTGSSSSNETFHSWSHSNQLSPTPIALKFSSEELDDCVAIRA